MHLTTIHYFCHEPGMMLIMRTPCQNLFLLRSLCLSRSWLTTLAVFKNAPRPWWDNWEQSLSTAVAGHHCSLSKVDKLCAEENTKLASEAPGGLVQHMQGPFMISRLGYKWTDKFCVCRMHFPMKLQTSCRQIYWILKVILTCHTFLESYVIMLVGCLDSLNFVLKKPCFSTKQRVRSVVYVKYWCFSPSETQSSLFDHERVKTPNMLPDISSSSTDVI